MYKIGWYKRRNQKIKDLNDSRKTFYKTIFVLFEL